MDLFTILIILLILIVVYSAIKSMERPANFPPGPRFYPWIGNTIQVQREVKATGSILGAFEKFSKQYNSNVIGLKMGSEYNVVAFTYPLIHEILLNQTFEGRPTSFFTKLRTMGKRLGLSCTDGKLWQEHRNFAMKELKNVGFGRSPMELLIKNATDDVIDYILSQNEEPIYPESFLSSCIIQVIWTLISGRKLHRADEKLQKLFSLLKKRRLAFDLSGGLLASAPWLRFIAPEKIGYNLIVELNKELFSFLQDVIDEHKMNYNENCDKTDFIYAYLREMFTNEDNEASTFNEEQLMATILDFFIAGSETTGTTINLALMIAALKPDIQEKLYTEIEENLEEGEFPYSQHKQKLPYMNAYIAEIQRCFYVLPLGGLRRTLKKTQLDGYEIPKHTTTFISVKSVLFDESHWKDPTVFRPERFLESKRDGVVDDYLIVFGRGRRRCPGEALARASIFSIFTKIVQTFHLAVPPGKTIDTNLVPGISYSPKPYEIRFVKRDKNYNVVTKE